MVDVLMATYNGEKYISQQIDSIINQSYKDIRLIISDDGSYDLTKEIIENYRTRYPEMIEVISDGKKTRSATGNFMNLVKHASSEYVMFCDQDDIWNKEKVRLSVDKIQEVEMRIGVNKPILVFGRYLVVDKNLNPIKPITDIDDKKLKLNRLIVQNYVAGCLSIVNKALYSIMGDYNDAIMMHDWWAALIASALGEIHYMPETLMLYRQHGNNCVGNVDTGSLALNIKKMSSGNAKKAQLKYKEQVMLFYDRYSLLLDDDKRNIIEEYINIYSKNKIARILGIIKGRYFKDTIMRTVGQFIYI